jgi:hypothetical protein
VDGKVMRWIVAAFLLLGFVIVFSACGIDGHIIKLTFVNESDSRLCFNLSSADAARGDSCNEVKPRGTSDWRPECASEQPLTVVLSVREGGREIYNRTATCNEWEASGAKFTIEQRGGDFVVTDPLPDAAPSQ